MSGPQRTAGKVAELLDLEGLEHGQARARYGNASGPRQRGEVVVSVLVALDPGRYERLLVAGHRAGLWGRPWWIDPATDWRRPVSGSRPPPMSFALSSPVRGAVGCSSVGPEGPPEEAMSPKSLQISPEALWRYQWVAQIETRVLAGEALARAIAGVRAHPRRDPRAKTAPSPEP